jgi:hypothetical protein
MSTIPGRIIPSDTAPSFASEAVTERAFELWIGGENWTPYAREVRFTNSGAEGASVVNFEARRPMDGYEDAICELWLAKANAGYLKDSDYKLYFAGTLTRPYPDSPWPGATAQALGPFAAMAGQPLGEDILYNGKTLAYSLNDVARRAYTVSGLVEVIGGHDITVEKGEFAQEVTLMEAARSLCNPVGYRMTDARGLKRLFFPEPQPGSTGKSRATYGPKDYASGDLKISDVHASTYFKVIVFRRSEWGVYEVLESALVEPQRVPKPRGFAYKKRIFYIGDFPGTSAQAKDTAHKQAHKLAVGEYDLEGLTVPYDPDIYRFDQITAWRERERQDGIWRETFDFVLEGGCDINVSDDTMTLKGFGLMTDEEWVRPVRIVVQRANPAVIVAPFQYPANPEESILVGDLLTVAQTRRLTVSDALSVADSLTASKNLIAITRTPSDSLGVTDTATPNHVQAPARTIANSVGVSDSASRQLNAGTSVSFSVTTSANDVYLGYSGNVTYPPTTSHTQLTSDTSTFVQAQRSVTGSNYQTYVGLMRFDTSSLPDGATILTATLELVQADIFTDTNALTWRAQWYSWDGVMNAPRDFAHLVSDNAIADVAISSYGTIGAAYSFALLNPTNVNKTGYTGLRIGLGQRPSDAAPTGVNRVRWASFDHATYAAPKLIVT